MKLIDVALEVESFMITEGIDPHIITASEVVRLMIEIGSE